VVAFLDRLAAKVLRQLWQFDAGEINGNGHVLLGYDCPSSAAVGTGASEASASNSLPATS
jgi:hypothetical protein